MSARIGRGWVVGLFGGVAGLVAVVVATTAGSSEGVRPVGAEQAPVSDGDAPCEGAIPMTIDDLAKQADFDVYVPASSFANVSSIDRSWWCGAGPAALVEFDSGIDMVLQSDRLLSGDPSGYWARRIEETGVGAQTTLANGVPAFTVAPGGEFDEFGNVQVDLGGTWVSIVGDSELPLDDLVETASSLGLAKGAAAG